MAKKTLNAGLVGYGMIGKVHAYSTTVLPWYAPDLPVTGRIVAVATSRMETALQAREQLGDGVAYDDYHKIIDDPSIDVVHICTPNAQHFPVIVDAIRAGKHIYCEKPIVSSVEEAHALREILSEVRNTGKNYQLAHHLRGFTALRRAKELIDAGRLGQIVHYRVGYYHSSMLDPTSPFRWKHDAAGGSIYDLASHLFDLVGWLIGLPAQLSAQATILTPKRPERKLQPGESLGAVPTKEVLAEDAVTVMTRGLRGVPRAIPKLATSKVLEYPSNAGADDASMPVAVADPQSGAAITGVVEATKLACGTEDELTLAINGTRGALRFSLMDPHYLEFFDATTPYGVNGGDAGWTRIPSGARYAAPESDFPSPKSTVGWLRAHVASLAAFYRGIADGKCYGASFQHALDVQDVLEELKRQTRNGGFGAR